MSDEKLLFGKPQKLDLNRNIFTPIKAIFFGIGIERSKGRLSFLRYFLNSARAYKVMVRLVKLRYPLSTKKQKETSLDPKNDKVLARVIDYTIEQDATQDGRGSSRRAEIYYQMLQIPPRDLTQENILVIGGKEIQELLMAYTYGFLWKNIYAIDLFSVHPKIKVMNMEDIQYEENSFNNIVMANVYGYQEDPVKCLREVFRVLKKGGLFAFNTANNLQESSTTLKTSCINANEMGSILTSCGFELITHVSETHENSYSYRWLLRKPLNSNNEDSLIYGNSQS